PLEVDAAIRNCHNGAALAQMGHCSRNPEAEILAVPRISVRSGRRPDRSRSLYASAALVTLRCRLTQILADQILDRAHRIFGTSGTLLTLRGLPFCRDLGLFLFRRLFRDYHGPVRLVTGLLVAGDGNPDNIRP